MTINTVPASFTPELRAFCATISSGKPVFIPSRPSADAQMSACFDNVARKIRRSGGKLVYGWAIWHVPGLYYEAEHHGAWRNREGRVLDVSPQLNGATRILFLPDRNAIYDPVGFRANRIAPAANTAASREVVELALRRNSIINSYRSDEYSAAWLSASDQVELTAINARLSDLLLRAAAER